MEIAYYCQNTVRDFFEWLWPSHNIGTRIESTLDRDFKRILHIFPDSGNRKKNENKNARKVARKLFASLCSQLGKKSR